MVNFLGTTSLQGNFYNEESHNKESPNKESHFMESRNFLRELFIIPPANAGNPDIRKWFKTTGHFLASL
jgi:hypothetical protein